MILCTTGSSLLRNYVTLLTKGPCFEIDCRCKHYGSINRSNYCHFEVDYSVNLLEKLFKGLPV